MQMGTLGESYVDWMESGTVVGLERESERDCGHV